MLPKFSKRPVEPAFPLKPETNSCECMDMTLRDYFAGQVLTFISEGPFFHPISTATQAYQLADAMLAVRNAKGDGQ